MPIWEETPGQNKDMPERLYFSAGLGTFCISLKELVEVAGKRKVWISLHKLFPPATQISSRRQNQTFVAASL